MRCLLLLVSAAGPEWPALAWVIQQYQQQYQSLRFAKYGAGNTPSFSRFKTTPDFSNIGSSYIVTGTYDIRNIFGPIWHQAPPHQWPARGHQKPPANPEALLLEYPSSFISIKDPLFGH
jgi:hypothetical protein